MARVGFDPNCTLCATRLTSGLIEENHDYVHDLYRGKGARDGTEDRGKGGSGRGLGRARDGGQGGARDGRTGTEEDSGRRTGTRGCSGRGLEGSSGRRTRDGVGGRRDLGDQDGTETGGRARTF